MDVKKFHIGAKPSILVAWVDHRGKLQYISNMSKKDKAILIKSIGDKNEKESNE